MQEFSVFFFSLVLRRCFTFDASNFDALIIVHCAGHSVLVYTFSGGLWWHSTHCFQSNEVNNMRLNQSMICYLGFQKFLPSSPPERAFLLFRYFFSRVHLNFQMKRKYNWTNPNDIFFSRSHSKLCSSERRVLFGSNVSIDGALRV